MMKSAALLLLSLLPVATVSAATSTDIPQIRVSGVAERKAAVDEMIWSISLRTEDKELPVAANQHTKLVGEVYAALEELGFDRKETQSSQVSFGENFEYRNNSRFRSGYYAQSSFQIRTTKMNTYVSVWMAMAKIEGVSINGVQFDNSRKDIIRNELSLEALDAARKKAARMAEVYNARLGEPLLIEELSGGVDVRNMQPMMMRAEAADAGTLPSPGTINLRSQVNVTFRLIEGN